MTVREAKGGFSRRHAVCFQFCFQSSQSLAGKAEEGIDLESDGVTTEWSALDFGHYRLRPGGEDSPPVQRSTPAAPEIRLGRLNWAD